MELIRVGSKMKVTGNFTVTTANSILPLKGRIGVVTRSRQEDNQTLVALLIGEAQYEIPISLLDRNRSAAEKRC